MEKNINLNSMEEVDCADIYLNFSGLLNWEKYKRLTTEDVKEWVEEDTKRRANEWVKNHFKDAQFDGMLYIGTAYMCLNCRYNKKENVVANYQLSYEKNTNTSFVEEDFRIIPEGKN